MLQNFSQRVSESRKLDLVDFSYDFILFVNLLINLEFKNSAVKKQIKSSLCGESGYRRIKLKGLKTFNLCFTR